ncbi:hypothetical protein GALMADRAFT_246253 [Galerina marginata CBS 339.88]|uniref:F-box domain-containing protein n=1 Tax=Galerina marginata (strain CBS 339.88) TaxID=685588 RepID=A0A067TB08_GALM3|nr:hypothetical protein GALMADRAFT_246253 [Galerina marginata CBS 339.88]
MSSTCNHHRNYADRYRHLVCMSSLSPFHPYFGTNYVPNDDEIAQIKSILSDKEEKLRVLGIELRRIQSLSDEISREVEEHRALVSPLRHLPTDILQEIFVSCLPATHNSTMCNDEAPTLLTHVCRAWRDIALATPQLWQSIHIPVPLNNPRHLEADEVVNEDYDAFALGIATKCSNLVAKWLERSGGCPVDISLDEKNTEFWKDNYCRTFIDAILDVSYRWRNVDICTSAEDMDHFLATVQGSELPSLHSLSLSLTSDPFRSSVKWTEEEGILNAPRLKEVSFIGVGGNFFKFPINWKYLTQLTIEDASTSVAGIGIMLRKCKNLVSCRLNVHTRGLRADQLAEFDKPIILPSLKRLSIREWEDDLSHFFTVLEAPYLQHLEYRRSQGWSKECTVLPLLKRSIIHTFITDGRLLKPEHLLDILRGCPDLKSLSIRPSSTGNVNNRTEKVFLNDQFLAQLSLPDDHGNYLCPNLQDFECHVGAQFTDDQLANFIRERRRGLPGVANLKRVAVSFARLQTGLTLTEIDPTASLDRIELDIIYFRTPFKSTFFPRRGLRDTSDTSSHPF